MKIVKKVWGAEYHIVNNDEYCGKILYFEKDFFCSYHKHFAKRETFYVASGRVVLCYGFKSDKTDVVVRTLEKGESFDVERQMFHQIIALENSEVYEFSTHDDPDDSYRLTRSGKI